MLEEAATALRGGGCLVIPTDTVYGLAALVGVPGVHERLNELKQRPDEMPIAVLVADLEQARSIARMSPLAERLADAHWPGALTLVVEALDEVGGAVGSLDGSVGVRWPDHPLVQALAAKAGPLATTSANLHGERTPKTAAEVATTFPDVSLVLDGGRCSGQASTVIDARGSRVVVLRHGPLRVL